MLIHWWLESIPVFCSDHTQTPARRPLLVCTDGLVSYIRAIRETFRDPVHTGKGGRPRLRPWRHVLIAQVVKRYERHRVVDTERRIVDGTPARVATLRRRSQGSGVINTAYIERLNATFRERLAPLARRCRALARHTVTLHEGMFLVGTVYNFCTPHESLSYTQKTTPAMAAGITDHGWTMHELLSFHVPLSAGHHPSNVGVPHMRSNASLSDGAGTTLAVEVPFLSFIQNFVYIDDACVCRFVPSRIYFIRRRQVCCQKLC